jgi:hypothetical protein
MLPTTRLHYMRGEYYLPWQRALGGERKEKAFGDMYAISAFGNEFALYRQDFMLHGGQTKGETYPRPGDQASAEVTKDVAPKSWWHYDATKQTGKDKLESIADIIKWKLLELGLISSKYSPLDPCHKPRLTTYQDCTVPVLPPTPPELLPNGNSHYQTETEATSSDSSPDSSFDDESKDSTYEPEPENSEIEDSEIED